MKSRSIRTATDMPIENRSIRCADQIGCELVMRKLPQGLSENSQSIRLRTGKSRKPLVKPVGTSVAEVCLL
jgi:hypothetical protein